MPQISISVTEGQHEELREIAQSSGLSISSLLRTSIDNIVNRQTISAEERLIIAMVSEIKDSIDSIAEKLAVKENEPTLLSDSLKGGYDNFINSEISAQIQPYMEKTENEFVLSVLDMYVSLQYSAREIGVLKKETLFPGFDSHAPENRMLSYFRFMRKHRRYSHVEVRDDNGDSHIAMSSKYEAMLPKWRKIIGTKDIGQGLTENEISKILGLNV